MGVGQPESQGLAQGYAGAATASAMRAAVKARSDCQGSGSGAADGNRGISDMAAEMGNLTQRGGQLLQELSRGGSRPQLAPLIHNALA